MKFVALISGGKDSIYSTFEAVRNGHELVACVHLSRPLEETEESYMYQTAASEVIPKLVEECLGVPLVQFQRRGTSVNTSLVYDGNGDQTATTAAGTEQKEDDQADETQKEKQADEVEDLYDALLLAKERFPEIRAISSGAILSTYQRVRIENVCSRLNLTSLSYLWRMAPQQTLLERMLADGIDAVLVKTACPPGLLPERHLNKRLGQLYYAGLFQKLHQKYQFHMLGEGGEYETLALDSPLHKKRLVIDEVKVTTENDDDGVGNLSIVRCHAEEKGCAVTDNVDNHGLQENHQSSTSTKSSPIPPPKSVSVPLTSTSSVITYLPHVKRVSGGLLHVGEITSSSSGAGLDASGLSEGEYAVAEAREILSILDAILKKHQSTNKDVMMVHLYLSEISHFSNINQYYQAFFGSVLPPSRSTVAVGKGLLPGGRRVQLDCLVQVGSGAYMRGNGGESPIAKTALQTTTSKLRDVLHVQSISYWAPVCVGPYSQVNTMRSALHFIAGQIGLIPETMKLRPKWQDQLRQSWKNAAQCLDALDGNELKNLLSGLVYVANDIHDWETVERICRDELRHNAGVIPGVIEGIATSSSLEDLYGGYEDEETWREMTKNEKVSNRTTQLPLLMVSIPEMPVGAKVEVELHCPTVRAISCLDLGIDSSSFKVDNSDAEGDMGIEGWIESYGAPQKCMKTNERVDVATRFIGTECTAMTTVVAYTSLKSKVVESSRMLRTMLYAGERSLLKSGLKFNDVVNVRLYYVYKTGATVQNALELMGNDGLTLRVQLAGALEHLCQSCSAPSTATIPVLRLKISHDHLPPVDESQLAVLAMQILAIQPTSFETEIWIHHGREA